MMPSTRNSALPERLRDTAAGLAAGTRMSGYALIKYGLCKVSRTRENVEKETLISKSRTLNFMIVLNSRFLTRDRFSCLFRDLTISSRRRRSRGLTGGLGRIRIAKGVDSGLIKSFLDVTGEAACKGQPGI